MAHLAEADETDARGGTIEREFTGELLSISPYGCAFGA